MVEPISAGEDIEVITRLYLRLTRGQIETVVADLGLRTRPGKCFGGGCNGSQRFLLGRPGGTGRQCGGHQQYTHYLGTEHHGLKRSPSYRGHCTTNCCHSGRGASPGPSASVPIYKNPTIASFASRPRAVF